MRKLKIILLISFSSVLLLVVIIILCFSPILKYLIEKYDEEYTGRKITLGLVYANPFTGFVHLSNVKMYEQESDSIFFSANSLDLNFALLKMFSKTYEISELTIDKPRGFVVQNKNNFNFNDLIRKFSGDSTIQIKKEPTHFNLLNFKIKNGEFHYSEKLIPINYFINRFDFESSGMRWDQDTIDGKFSFFAGIGQGDIKGSFTMNVKTNAYKMAVKVHHYDLTIIEQYMKELSNYGTFSAQLDASFNAAGNLNDAENLIASGTLEVSDFQFGKNRKDNYVSFQKLYLSIIELSPKNHKYFFDALILEKPTFKYERYDSLDNLETMFGKSGAKITAVNGDPERFNLVLEIARYVKTLAKNFFQSEYTINKLAITKGDVNFNDYSISEKFSIHITPISILADSIDKSHERVNVAFKTGIVPYGNANIDLSISPQDSADFDMKYQFEKMAITMFNPYTITYTSFPLDRGTIEMKGVWHVRNGIIDSDNHLTILDPRVTKRLRNKDTKWIPLPLIMAFVRERGNVIDYEIPISGNLKDPKFHLRDIVVDLLTNVFVKPSTTPYRIELKNTEQDIEKSLTLKWGMRNSTLLSKQGRFVERTAEFLAKNPDAKIDITPIVYATKEKEYILFYEAKKKYYISSMNLKDELFLEEDSERVSKMSIKDSLFVRYLNSKVNDSLVFTIQEKCLKLIGTSILQNKFEEVSKKRELLFRDYFKKEGVENRVKFSKTKNDIPYNGFSYYSIDYNGVLPDYLIKAYAEMNEFNEKQPRNKFLKERKKAKLSVESN